ncbi:MAG: hypothetical protein DRI44_02510 [Chlamydiae bacterium]|nr:MAG: hypothetical protein DRI44_02510 [Chlamydiota bacterium]
MLNHLKKKRIPLWGFALAIAILAIIIIIYSIMDYVRTRERFEQSLIRESLKVIESFESSVRIGLTGRRLWDKEKLHALIMDNCRRSDLNSFCFIDPTLKVFYVSKDFTTNFYEPDLTNIYNILLKQPYYYNYLTSSNGVRSFCITKPLLLDNAERIGKRTFRFYQVFLDRKNQHKTLREFRPFRNNVYSLPLARICLPLDDINALTRHAVIRMMISGIIIFILGSLVFYVITIVQHHGALSSALKRVREENKQLVEGIIRADRLSLIGRMAATLAHDIRNPLGSIGGFTQLFKKEFIKTNNAEMSKYADIVISEVNHLNSIVKRTLLFSKPLKPSFKSLDIKPLFSRILELIKRDISIKNVVLHSDISVSLPKVKIDEHLISQTLLNILLNALDAMPDGGTLEVFISKTIENDLEIKISDTGSGIPKDKIKDIFQPYYSTKPTGTGIGLAVVDNIIATHGGTITVKSELGKGTTFVITLPASK